MGSMDQLDTPKSFLTKASKKLHKMNFFLNRCKKNVNSCCICEK